ncbi:acyltransferase [Tumidithrix elongata RA019]|uniref:Acyltransferase n=1 Tax=Tumidithrix elongata BACA0141 TaxID=2716417 RepID=A0AAW9Q3M6_9CYAN|nr:acyltransferase [Tumidithrix elongata RA019]
MQDLNKSTHIPYRPDIDGLRAIAVVPVVIFHAFPESALIGGFMGVDIFFVISGFLISLILLGDLNKKKFSFLTFYSRRILRIFPALITVLSFCLLVGWLSLFPDEYKQVAKHVASGTAFIVNLVLWNEVGYFDTSAALKPLLHLWSLGVEEQFYIIWPVLLLFIWKAKFGFFRTTLILGAASFFASIYIADTDQTQVFYSPLTRFWELMVGGNLAYLVIKYNKYIENVEGRHHKFQSLIRALLNIQSFIGSLFIALGLLLFGISFPGFLLRFLVVMLPVLGVFLLISFRPNAWINRKIISNKLLVLVIHNKYFKFIVGVLLVALGLFTFGTSKSADLLLKFLVVMLPAFGAFLLISAGPNAWVNRKIISNKFLASIGLARFWGQMVGGNLAFRAIQNIYNQCIAAKQHNFLALIRTLLINLQSFIGTLLIVLSLFLFGNSSKLPGFLVKAPVVMLPVFGAFLLIAAGPSAWINRKILSNKLFVSIGLISYPLYLWHWPLLAFPRIGISDGSYRDILPLNRFIAILVSVFLSWATYQFIEKPIRFGGKKQIWTLILGLAMIGIGIFGSIVFMSNGIPDRIALTPPTASILFSDYPHPLKNEACKNQYPEFKDGFSCLLSKPQKPNVALFGDSHAHQYYD